jgi:hypothetical protein
MDSETDVDAEPVVPEHVRHGPFRVVGRRAEWRVGCSCGWGMVLDEPPYGEQDAEQDWRYHLADVVSPRAGETFYASTQPQFEMVSGVQTQKESWYKGAIRSTAKWRRDFPMWLCDHRHESESEALACAEKELPLWLKESEEGYQPKPGEEFQASSMPYGTSPFGTSIQRGERAWFGVITSQKSPTDYHEARWECGHRHKSRADAVACAEEQLKDKRWHP